MGFVNIVQFLLDVGRAATTIMIGHTSWCIMPSVSLLNCLWPLHLTFFLFNDIIWVESLGVLGVRLEFGIPMMVSDEMVKNGVQPD